MADSNYKVSVETIVETDIGPGCQKRCITVEGNDLAHVLAEALEGTPRLEQVLAKLVSYVVTLIYEDEQLEDCWPEHFDCLGDLITAADKVHAGWDAHDKELDELIDGKVTK